MKPLKIKCCLVLFWLVLSLALHCQTALPDSLTIQQLIEIEINEANPGILMGIQTTTDCAMQWAAGYDDAVTKDALTARQTFRIASVTKTFVAAAILRLWEDGHLGLDDPIAKYISPMHKELLIQGGYQPNVITIRHLLTHSSGMADHSHTMVYDTTNFIKARWTRTSQLQLLVEQTKPLGNPGEKFSYSDTGYVLLGEILEKVTGLTMGEAIDQLLDFEKLGLHSTIMEAVDGDFSGKRIHQYYRGQDTYYFHPSIDYYGGGGLLSNTGDLCRFYWQLFNGKVFRQAATLDTMCAPQRYEEAAVMDYRMGIWEIEIGGQKAYTHTGFWGTQVVYFPEINASAAVNYSSRWKNKGIAPSLSRLAESWPQKE